MTAQRLRVTFSRGEAVKHIAHLDLMRLWELALRQAGVPLAYAEGSRRTPRLSLAAPLPVGVTSSCELMDVFLAERLALRDFLSAISDQTVAGIEVMAAREVGLAQPSLQSLVRWAEYEVEVGSGGRAAAEVETAIETLLAADSIPWQHARERRIRRYDLRLLVLGLWLEGADGETCRLGMRLRTDKERAGRCEQVSAALGFPEAPTRIHRSRLYVEETSAATQAYRRLGEP
ncbi:MAG: TIGR03936 family radical SAM-associated protein [Dehalococcoidia bacterium]